MSKKQLPNPKDPNNQRIPEIPPPDTPLISFSFKHTVLNCPKFKIEGKNNQYFLKVIERMKALCGETALSLKRENTSEKNGFKGKLPISRKDNPPYQISISGNEHGRLHGFFIGEIFHVVWFDPDHKLYA
jgi:hypothetical protein